MARSSGSTGPTLAVVAREAGVSVPTASKVVNGREDVAPDTRRRVTEVLDRLGYIRRPRCEAPKPTAMVDLVVHSLDSAWSGAVLHGAAEAAHEAGLEVVVSAAATRTRGGRLDPGRLDKLYARGSSGVLFHLTSLAPAQYLWLDERRIPFVLIDPADDPPPGVPSVAAANWQGGMAATEHLIELGHRRIAVIGGHGRTVRDGGRVAGYRSAMAAAGLPVPSAYVRYGDISEAAARHRMGELLDLAEPPTAVFVCSDQMALGVYQAVRERGLRMPQDISVVGFDDLPQARWITPALTTVRQPLAEMAAAALRTLVRLMTGEVPEATRTELSTRLMVRSSTAPPLRAPS
ncbi:LacI family DNA-binding transcriptional regulator [Streptomyces sp. S465]|uniref:LacI family DNA-binding transcriptional regulator n=1 Tax=Streptomyces sp. S465 TaxID=2979468 RepID=UPI0022A8ADEC|nr:substrate-binding domain-containing protein [Streptomyces sp. S465]WAP53879.1 substrate-binding domain-containing protein [Streptomyces sp. S465]